MMAGKFVFAETIARPIEEPLLNSISQILDVISSLLMALVACSCSLNSPSLFMKLSFTIFNEVALLLVVVPFCRLAKAFTISKRVFSSKSFVSS